MRKIATVILPFCFAAIAARAACPTAEPAQYLIKLTTSCITCPGSQPVTFTLAPHDSCIIDYFCTPGYVIQACDSVVWNFGDGTPPLTIVGSASVSHTFATGNIYPVSATVSNSLGTTAPLRGEVQVANDPATFVSIDAPTTISEAAPALNVTFARSGNLDVPSNLTYNLVLENGAQRFSNAGGSVVFAPGEAEKVLSFAEIGNDTLFSGLSTYTLEVDSADATVITAGLQETDRPYKRRAAVSVFDDDPPSHLRLNDVVIPEGTGTGLTYATLTATLDRPLGRGFSAVLQFPEFTHGLVLGSGVNALQFGAGETTGTFSLPIRADAAPSPDQTIEVSIFSLPPELSGLIIDRPIAHLTILNDDIGFSPSSILTDAGKTVTVAVNLGVDLGADDVVHFTSSDPSVATAAPLLTVGHPYGEVTIHALHGGEATIDAEVVRPAVTERGQIYVNVFQPAALVADADVVRLRVGDEATLRISVSTPQPAPVPIVVQTATDGIVSVVAPPTEIPSGGNAVLKLRALAIGKTSLIVLSPGQQKSLVIPVEVGGGRRRSAGH